MEVDFNAQTVNVSPSLPDSTYTSTKHGGRYDAGLLLLAVTIVLAVSPIFPQATTANVVGTVTDPSGGLVPAATVTIRNRQTGQTRTTQTDAQGTYEFRFLQIGEYSITVEKAGFSEVRSRAVLA